MLLRLADWRDLGSSVPGRRSTPPSGEHRLREPQVPPLLNVSGERDAVLRIRRYDRLLASRSFSSSVQFWIGAEGMDDSNGPASPIVRKQAVFRAVNERIEATNKRFGVALWRTESSANALMKAA